jgi:hypothetical protein
MFNHLQTLWIFAASLCVAGGAGGAHWWWCAPVYEAQASVRLIRGPDRPSATLGGDGELPEAVLDDAIDQLARLDVPLGDPENAAVVLAGDVRCRVVPATTKPRFAFEPRSPIRRSPF